MSPVTETFAPGAPAAAGQIPLSVPVIEGNEWEYIRTCLDTNYVSSVGPFVTRFESEMCSALGTAHAIATSTGTAALHTALMAARIPAGSEVVLPALSFIASANSVRYIQAIPTFVGVSRTNFQMDPQILEAFVRRECERRDVGLVNKKTGRVVSAIMPVHILGHPCDMDPIMAVAREFGLPVVEDAAESLGSLYKGQAPGSFGDAGCLSFNGNKILTTGAGGMVVTQRDDIAARARHLSTQAKTDTLEYVHDEVGYNYRMNNVLAAIGCAQLERLESIVDRKREIASVYAQAFSDLPLRVPIEEPWAKSTYWLYTIIVDHDAGYRSRELMGHMASAGIQTRPVWQPLHRSLAHSDSYAFACESAEWVNERALSLPSTASLTSDEQARVIEAVRAYFTRDRH